MRLLTLSIVLALTSCQVVPVKLLVPPEPSYPKVSGAEMECLSDDAYTRIIRRDDLRKAYIEQLQNVIKATD